jgi:clan AA aspartic protease (TIGR02281 family)
LEQGIGDGKMKLLLAIAAAMLSTAAAAQTTVVTVNGQSFEMGAGTTATFVTDGHGTRMVTTGAASTGSSTRTDPRDGLPYEMRTAQTTPARQSYAPPHPSPAYAPRLEYADFDEPEVPMPGIQPLRIRRDRFTGHFIAPVMINGVKVRVIVDTGATGTILSPEDAMATGADRDVTATRPGVGIGGYTTLSMTRVRSMEIGGQRLKAFDADIGQQGIRNTLLGQTEIAKLGRIVIEDNVMTIYPRGVQMASR